MIDYTELHRKLLDWLVGEQRDDYVGKLPDGLTQVEKLQKQMEQNRFHAIVNMSVSGILHLVQEVDKSK